MRIAVVSPHLDDAVLSLGATIASAVADDASVHVLTLFSRTVAASRARDDERALALLGAHAHHLDLLDAPVRGIPLTWRDLCGPAHDGGDLAHLVNDARGALAHGLDDLAPDAIWAPLGCGHHIDHRVACLASLPFATALYEERPYARAAGSVVDAWLALDASGVLAGASADAEVDARVPFLDAVGAPASKSAFRAIPREVSVRGARWRREARPVDDVARGLRLRAIEAYASERDSVLGVDDSDRERWPFSDKSEVLWHRSAPS